MTIFTRARAPAARSCGLRDASIATADAVAQGRRRQALRAAAPSSIRLARCSSRSHTTTAAARNRLARVLARAPHPPSPPPPPPPPRTLTCAPHAARWHLGPQYHTRRHRAHRNVAGAPHTSHAPAPPPPPVAPCRSRTSIDHVCTSDGCRWPTLIQSCTGTFLA